MNTRKIHKKIMGKLRPIAKFTLVCLTAYGISGSLLASDGSYVKSVPIKIAPGMGGVHPEISLVYSSESQGDLLGLGWQLSGIPKIVGKQVGGQIVYLGRNGRMVFTGNPGTGDEYRYFKENFSKLRFYTRGDGIREWEETDANGVRYYYLEKSSNIFALDRVEAHNNLGYEVYYTTFPGNDKLYPEQVVYTTQYGTAQTITKFKRVYFEYITKPDTRVVYFDGSKYIDDKILTGIRVEDNVQCSGDLGCGDLLRRYRFLYTHSGPLSTTRLRVVEVSDSTGNNYLPVETYLFQAFDPEQYSTLSIAGYDHNDPMKGYYSGLAEKQYTRGIYADINGDGLVDKIISYSAADSNGVTTNTGMRTYLNMGSGWEANYAYNPPSYLFLYRDGPYNNPGSVFANGQLIDVNGDGLPDVVSRCYGGSVRINQNGSWGSSTYQLTSEMKIAPYDCTTNLTPEHGQWIDINGDGLIDWVLAYRDSNSVKHQGTWLNTGSGWEYNAGLTLPTSFLIYGYAQGNQVKVGHLADVNGDGLPDLVRSYRGYNQSTPLKDTWINTGTSFVEDLEGNFVLKGLLDDWQFGWEYRFHKSDLIDINGDGLVDQVVSYKHSVGGGFANTTYMNNGQTFVEDSNYALPVILNNHEIDLDLVRIECNYESVCVDLYAKSAYQYPHGGGKLADINGDGLVDFIVSHQYEGESNEKRTYLNDGTKFVDKNQAYRPPIAQALINFDYIAYSNTIYKPREKGSLVDINGDGVLDWVMEGSLGAYQTRITYRDQLPNKMIRITSDLGGYTQIRWSKAAFTSGAIQPVIDSFPFSADTRPRQIVYQLSTYDGKGARYDTDFSYEALKVYRGDLHLRRSVGPAAYESSLPDGTVNRIEYNQGMVDDGKNGQILLANWPKYKSRHNNGALVGEEYTNYEVVPFSSSGNETYYVRSRSHLETQSVSAGPAKIQKEYDVGGALVKHEELLAEYVGTTEYLIGQVRQTTTNLYDPDPSNPNTVLHTLENKNFFSPIDGDHVIGQVREVITKVDGGFQSIVKSSYDAKHNLILSRRYRSVSNDYIDTTYEHDEYGNVVKTTSPTGIVTRHIFQWDPVESVTTAVDSTDGAITFTGTKTYDRFGNLVKETDTKGRVLKEMIYDNYGRLTDVKNQNGVIVEKYLHYDNIKGDPNAQYTEVRKYNLAGDFLSEKNYFDGLGRSYKTVSEVYDDNGKMSKYVFIEYNAQGRAYRESVPLFSKTYKSEIDVERWKTSLFDLYGRLEGEMMPGINSELDITTGYRYLVTPKGRRYTEITDSMGNVDTTYYNAQGKVEKEVDPANGVTLYTYDDADRIYTVTDANSQDTITKLDNWGNVIELVEPNTGLWTFVYNLDNKLLHKYGPDGYVTSISYDTMMRKSQISYKGVPTIFYTYDNDPASNGFGSILNVTDQSGITNYQYDPSGRIERVSKTITPAAEDTGNSTPFTLKYQYVYDNLDRVTQLIYPDGSTLTHDFAANGFLRELRLKTVVDQTPQTGESTMVTYQGPFNLDDTTQALTVKRIAGNGVVTTATVDHHTQTLLKLQTGLDGGALDQDLEYSYNSLGHITTITDHLNATLSEAYQYDEVGRLTQAMSGLYGLQVYHYTAGGNLTFKGNRGMFYGNEINPYPGTTENCSVSVQAVCSDSEGNSYSYDVRGNMIGRGNINAGTYRTLTYDLENRLRQVKDGAGNTKARFEYDHDGKRTLKVSADGTVTYFFENMYEVMVKPNGVKYHTKYILGAKGDMIAQHTLDSSRVQLASLDRYFNIAMAGVGFSFRSLGDFTDSVNYWLAAVYHEFNTDRMPLALYFVLLSLVVLAVVYIKSNFKLRLNERQTDGVPVDYVADRKLGFAETAVLLLFFIFSFFSFNCFDAATIGEPVPFSAFDPNTAPASMSDNLGLYNDTAENARPTLGLLYYHANHLGSTAMLSNDAGVMVSHIAYKPYGEVIRNPAGSDGPDTVRAKYTGHQEDPETSLIYMNARYYDPGIGRFISADSFNSDAGTQGFNRYMYAYGNPVNMVDPTGHMGAPQDWFMGLLGLGVIAVGIYAIVLGVGNLLSGNIIGGLTYIGMGIAAVLFGIGMVAHHWFGVPLEDVSSFVPNYFSLCFGACGQPATSDEDTGETSVITKYAEPAHLGGYQAYEPEPFDLELGIAQYFGSEHVQEILKRRAMWSHISNRYDNGQIAQAYQKMEAGNWEEQKGRIIRDALSSGATGEHFDQQFFVDNDARKIVYLYNRLAFQAYFFNKSVEINGKKDHSNYSNIDLGHYLEKTTEIVLLPLGMIKGGKGMLSAVGDLPEWGPLSGMAKWGYDKYGETAWTRTINSDAFSNNVVPSGSNWVSGGEINHREGLQDVIDRYNDSLDKVKILK